MTLPNEWGAQERGSARENSRETVCKKHGVNLCTVCFPPMNSRDKSVTIPMVQEVYGTQPQIRAGIGPAEPVRPMSEQELVKRLTPLMTDDRSWMQGPVKKILSIIRDYVRQQSEPVYEHDVCCSSLPTHPVRRGGCSCESIRKSREDALLELAIEMGFQQGLNVRWGWLGERPTPNDVRKRFEERR